MKKVFVFLSDGIGLRNFVFGEFQKVASKFNLTLSYWNNTEYPIQEKVGLNEIKIENAKNHFFSDLIKIAKKELELRYSYKETNDKIYLSYMFKASCNTFKNLIKSQLVNFLILISRNEKSIERSLDIDSKIDLIK